PSTKSGGIRRPPLARLTGRGSCPVQAAPAAVRIASQLASLPVYRPGGRMDAPQRRRPPAAKAPERMRKADRKRQLLAHAKQLFVTLGYQHTTTEKIARAAGVSEPVLYRHFESKKALFLEVLQEVREATINRWKAETGHL